MAKTIELLLTESVDNLGIVGDVVKVRTGYARNFLLPRSMATEPSEEMIKSLAVKRADAEKEIAQIRKARESTVSKLSGIEIQLTRACNDMGILYGAVTQQEISKALQTKGYDVRPRDVRIPHAIKRVDTYEIHIKFEADLEAVIKLWVMPDRKLDEDKKSDMDFDREGNLIEARPGRDRDRGHREDREEKAAAPAAPAEKPAKADKAEKSDKTEKPAKAEKAEKADKADKPAKEKAPKAPKAPKAEKGDKAIEKSTKGSWSKPIEKAPDFMQERKPRRSKD
ncbi:MAG: 50S ribosomal protein L9 [Pyrinomonadaceae bacterium]|nr:50S ribosomal protein L9 [Phycisphaerales bacterium]